MNILVIGGGGREHAIVRKLLGSPNVSAIYALPGNAGIASDAVCAPVPVTETDTICDFAIAHHIDFAVVAPDDPLCLGLVDMLEEVGVPAFGPGKDAARIEGSKSFAKELMKRHGIPTAAYEIFDDAAAALEYVGACPLPVFIKADGLALGKGAVFAGTREDAAAAVREMMVDKRFGKSGERIVIEECMTGPEASLLLFADGETYRLMPSAMDHKRALDGDMGENTGGMGVIAPNPLVTPSMLGRIEREIVRPTLAAMRDEGCPFKGCLFIGLMLTPDGPKVVEYNCRFGDPEAQAVLSLLDSDLLPILMAARDGTLAAADVRFSGRAACCVVLASGGYPGAYRKGLPIFGYEKYLGGNRPDDVRLDFAGVANGADGLVTAGGRVLGVTAVADTLPGAIERAYDAAGEIRFEWRYMRRDIGANVCGEHTVKK